VRYVLGLSLIVAAIVGGGCGCGDATPSTIAGAHGAATARVVGAVRLRLVIPSQRHLMARHLVAVRAFSRSGGRVRFAVTAVETIPGRQQGRRKRLTRTKVVSLAPGAPRTVRLPLTRGGAAALATCACYRLEASVRRSTSRRGQVLALGAEHLDTERCQRFFAPTGVWNRPLRDDAPLDPQSAQLVATLRQAVADAVTRRFWPTINTTQYSTPIYQVPENQRRLTVTLDDPAGYRQSLREALRAVPVPPGAEAAGGNDQHMVIWQPSKDTMWEFWKMHQVGGQWHARAAGRMQDVSKNPGYFAGPRGSPWGATATSLPLVGGLMLPNELRRGRIDHALAISIPRPRASTWSLPAQRTDGWVSDPAAVPEGTRFRLDPSVNVAKLELPRPLRAMAFAAQHYGIVVRDTAATPVFYAEDPRSLGSNPYPKIFEHQPLGPMLARFPWDHLQAMKLELQTYGGPSNSG
jgi:hypothetical protein